MSNGLTIKNTIVAIPPDPGRVLSGGSPRFLKPMSFLLVVVRFVFFVASIVSPVSGYCDAGFSDRVVAFVDDQAITMSELQDRYRDTVRLSPSMTMEEVLNTMINRIVLLREARRYRIDAPTIEEVLQEYIDLKIRSLIRIGEADKEKFYRDNLDRFPDREYEDVREEIELYLTEKELNERLKKTLAELKGKAYIRVLLGNDQKH